MRALLRLSVKTEGPFLIMSGLQPGEVVSQKQKLFESLKGGDKQVRNNEDGYVHKLDDLKRLQRFLIMGTEGGSYYAKEQTLTRENIECLDRLIKDGKGLQAVNEIKEVSVNRRNVKQNSVLLAYSICARNNDKDTKRAAYAVISEVCRIPTHLFMFVKFCEQESKNDIKDAVFVGSGWGRAHKRAISKWYTNFVNQPEKLARLVSKFKNREGWTHKDLLRVSHTSTRDRSVGFILRFIVRGLEKAREMYIDNAMDTDNDTISQLDRLDKLFTAFEKASNCSDVQELCSLVREYELTWEQCNSALLKSKEVWMALLPHMPIEAAVRNLGRMTSYGLFTDKSDSEKLILEKILSIGTLDESVARTESKIDTDDSEAKGDQSRVKAKRKNLLHPFKILLAIITYKAGKGDKGSLKWIPNKNIIMALDTAFYQAFEGVEPTGKKFYLGVDVSGSMSQGVLGIENMTCATAAAAMMMVTARTEQNCIIKGFSYDMRNIGIKPTDSLAEVEKKMNVIPMGSTDCAKPMLDAMENKIKDIDVFVIYTDNETWFGRIHPCEAIRQYRKYSERPNAKLVVVGMCATEFTIADQDDQNMIDVVGFDSAAPRLLSEFALDRI
ncbi:RNA-binding protein RO60-like [Ruditapes philippinarum]|uniref:RNA-binding protein RO60-like n=1 Tax=Ruditapes philippinarum TaxID=129788 RepID=UPI00295BBAE2|nr:RNA-binding protein RO60-like [Ruditapes philippinarum]